MGGAVAPPILRFELMVTVNTPVTPVTIRANAPCPVSADLPSRH